MRNLLTDVVPSMPQLLDSSKPLQTRPSEPTLPPPYPETAYQWLVETLDGLIDFGQRHGHYGVINLSDDEYQWLMDDVLWELICSVGEDENHPLAPLMDFIIRIIANYEDKYVPKLTELFPELAEESPIEITNENSNPPPYASELSDSELAAHGFFSIGCLLWEGGQVEKALSAYDTAIRLQPNYAEVYNNRGNIKSGLGSHDAALDDYNEAIRLNPNFMNAYINRGIAQLGLSNIDKAETDLRKALELANQQENTDAKAFIEEELQQLNRAALKQTNKKSRNDGQWKGKVKIAEDFDELPESFMTSFRAEKE